MNTPFFSIVIPTFNRANILSRSIDSVLNQTYQNFELIIVDNGSTDTTQKWLDSAYQDDRVIYYYQKGSGSPASPRNTGISFSKGQWVCFLDSDDRWCDTKLEDVYRTIQEYKNLDVVCHNEQIYYECDDVYGRVLKYGPMSNDLYREMLIYGNRLSTSATSIRINFLKKNNLSFNESDEFSTVEDYDLWLNLAKCGAEFKFLSKLLGFYTVGESNMIFTSGLFCKNLNNLLKKHVFSIQQFDDNKQRTWKLIKLRSNICQVQYMQSGSLSKIVRIIKIFSHHPVNFLTLLSGYIKRKVLLNLNI